MTTYAELMTWPIERVKEFLAANPNHIGADNALRQLEFEVKGRRAVARYTKKHGTVSGMTKVRRKGKCPTKKALRGNW